MNMLFGGVAILAGLGVLFGAGLAVAARVFHIETDPRAEHVLKALPGINCGACGYPGCEAYAGGILKGAAVDLCVPGGPATARAVAQIMGKRLDSERRAVRAVVHCQGGCDAAPRRFLYDGLLDCRAADALQGGDKSCEYGCLGYSSCARVCPFGAITMSDEPLPVIDRSLCTGCGLCVRACPRNIIETLPDSVAIALACCNRDSGREARRACAYGCIKCRKCVRESPEGAIEMQDNLPRLNYTQSFDFTAALQTCPQHCFVTLGVRGFTRSAVDKAPKSAAEAAAS